MKNRGCCREVAVVGWWPLERFDCIAICYNLHITVHELSLTF